MSSSMTKYIFITGMFLLFHAAYSAAQRKSCINQSFKGIPLFTNLSSIWQIDRSWGLPNKNSRLSQQMYIVY